MYNNNLDTLDASDQMLSPQIKLPLWFVRKKLHNPNNLLSPYTPTPQKKDKNDLVTPTKLIEWVGLSTIDVFSSVAFILFC